MGKPVRRKRQPNDQPKREQPDLGPAEIAQAEDSFARIAATWDVPPSPPPPASERSTRP